MTVGILRKVIQYKQKKQMAQAAPYPFDKWNFQVFINIEKYNVLFKIKYYIRIIFVLMAISQPTFTCSKLTTETREKGAKYVQN